MEKTALYRAGVLKDTAEIEKLNPRLAAAFEFLRKTDLAALSAGRHDIDGDDCFAMVNEIFLKPVSEGRCEAHGEYIDIHVPLTGSETLGYAPTPESVLKDAFEKEDIVFFDAPFETVDVAPGGWVLFFPPDGHVPGLTLGAPRFHRKIVVKVRK